MKYHLFINKYYTKAFKHDLGFNEAFFNYEGELLSQINNTAKLDIVKEKYVLKPKVSQFTPGYEHFFSIESICGNIAPKSFFIMDFLEQTFDLLEDISEANLIFSTGVWDNIDISKFERILCEYFNIKITVVFKDFLFVGAITYLSINRGKSITLLSGFNLTSSILNNKGLRREVNTIWQDKLNAIDNIRYHNGYEEIKDDREYQRIFDLILDSKLNYKNEDVTYIFRDHKYKMENYILDEYIQALKENINKLSNKDSFYLFDQTFPLIYDEFIKCLGIDIDKSTEIKEFYKFVLEYLEILLSFNTPYLRIKLKKTRNHSLYDGCREYDLLELSPKRIKEINSLFSSKYVKEK